MPARLSTRWIQHLITFALWALCGVSLAWWGLRLTQGSAPGRAPLAVSQAPVLDAQALARLLGADAVPSSGAVAAAPTRLVLLGVLAGTVSGDGAALIAIDGKPAKPYRVGREVEPGLIVQSLGAREARLGAALDGPATMTLELPRKR